MTKRIITKTFGIAACAALLGAGRAFCQPAQGSAGTSTRQTRAVLQRRGLRLGAIPSSTTALARACRFRVRDLRPAERPESLLLTKYLPPVASQGTQNSCVAWSSCYYCYSYSLAERLDLDPAKLQSPVFQFSPSFVYNLGNQGKDIGMQMERAFNILRDQGCAKLSALPYKEDDYKRQPDDDARTQANRYKADSVALVFKGRIYTRTSTPIQKLQSYLTDSKTPFAMTIPIFADFPMGSVEPDFVYRHAATKDEYKSEGFGGYHAITVVGFDTRKQAIRIVNSWGPGWGDHGFLWLDNSFVSDYAVEGWGAVPGGPVSTHWGRRVEVIPPAAGADANAQSRKLKRKR